MSNGVYDYKQLADEFLKFATEVSGRVRITKEDRAALLDYAYKMVGNACYRLPEIRQRAIDAGQDIVGIPVNLSVQQRVNDEIGTVAKGELKFETPVVEPPVVPSAGRPQQPPVEREAPKPRPTAPAGAARQSGPASSGEVATPVGLSFDMFGEPM